MLIDQFPVDHDEIKLALLDVYALRFRFPTACRPTWVVEDKSNLMLQCAKKKQKKNI